MTWDVGSQHRSAQEWTVSFEAQALRLSPHSIQTSATYTPQICRLNTLSCTQDFHRERVLGGARFGCAARGREGKRGAGGEGRRALGGEAGGGEGRRGAGGEGRRAAGRGGGRRGGEAGGRRGEGLAGNRCHRRDRCAVLVEQSSHDCLRSAVLAEPRSELERGTVLTLEKKHLKFLKANGSAFWEKVFCSTALVPDARARANFG